MILEKILHSFLINLGLTVVIEGIAAFLLGVRTFYGQIVVLLTNTVTNPLLNAIIVLVSFYISPDAYWYSLIFLEAAVVITEGLIFKKMLQLKLNCFLFSFILNFCSYSIGMIILKII